MTLNIFPVRVSIAVTDLEAADRFYGGQLGLDVEHDGVDSRIYRCAGSAGLHIYVSREHAGKNPATTATWYVDDLDHVVNELAGHGVTFEQYDTAEIRTDNRGIYRSDDVAVAWFTDPDGNVFALEQG